MTLDLDRAKAMLAAATPGPWEFSIFSENHPCAGWPSAVYAHHQEDLEDEYNVEVAGFGDVDAADMTQDEAMANAQLIAAAPTLIADLIAEVERLREVIDGWTHAEHDVAALHAEIERLRGELVEAHEAVLLRHTFINNHSIGWWQHPDIGDQGHALAALVKLGVYELHPENPALFRRVERGGGE